MALTDNTIEALVGSQEAKEGIPKLERSEQLDNEQLTRLWEHKLQVETVFYNRLNFFLIFESLLLGGIISVVLSNNKPSEPTILIVIALFGFVVAIFWMCVQFNQAYIFGKLKKRLMEVLPEYKETIRQREEGRLWLITLIQFLSTLKCFGLSIPSLVALVWFVLLVYITFH
jgi:hypothetical protein